MCAFWVLTVLGCAGTNTETVAVAETCAGVPSVEEPVAGQHPQYPMRAAQRRIEGWVDLKVTLGSEGRVENAEICGLSDDGFMRSALRAVRTWRYAPLAVSELSQITLRVRFVDDGSLRKQEPYFLSPQELVVAPEHWEPSSFGEPIPYEPTNEDGPTRGELTLPVFPGARDASTCPEPTEDVSTESGHFYLCRCCDRESEDSCPEPSEETSKGKAEPDAPRVSEDR